jgi:hypothetical protein
MTPGVRKHFRKVMDDKALRYRIEKWFWVANIPAALFLFFFFRPFWDAVSILYLALVSIYALVLTAGGAEQAAEAAVAASED